MTCDVWMFRDTTDDVFRFELAGPVPTTVLGVAGVRTFDAVRLSALRPSDRGPCVSVRCPGRDWMPARVVADMLIEAGYLLGGSACAEWLRRAV